MIKFFLLWLWKILTFSWYFDGIHCDVILFFCGLNFIVHSFAVEYGGAICKAFQVQVVLVVHSAEFTKEMLSNYYLQPFLRFQSSWWSLR